MREWKGRTRSTRVVAQLEGFEAPAGAWETEILPARLAGYEPAWLDDRCLAGRIAWARLRPRNGRTDGERAGRHRCARRRSRCCRAATPRIWTSLSPARRAGAPSPRAQTVADYIREHGASFFDELVEGTGLLRPRSRRRSAELVALGLVNSDSFAGLRALLVPSTERKPVRRAPRAGARALRHGGCRPLGARPPRRAGAPRRKAEAVEHVARTLLRRYGVVFWRLLEREAAWLPPWRDLLRVYRRLESARRDPRRPLRRRLLGRAVRAARRDRLLRADAAASRRPAQWVSLSGADPLNLVGILTPGRSSPR